MDRLTMTSDKGGVALAFDLDITCKPSEAQKILRLAERVKAYEDTGLTPEEVVELAESKQAGRQVLGYLTISMTTRVDTDLGHGIRVG